MVIGVGIYAYQKHSLNTSGAIKIGAALGLTGYGSAWGEGEREAIQLAVEEFNAKGALQVQVITEDTKSTGEGTVNAITKLVNVDHVLAIIGPTWGDSFQGAYPLTQQKHVPIITPSGAMETIENKSKLDYLFSTWLPQQPETAALVQYLLNHNLTRVATVTDLDAFNKKATEIFIATATAKGLTVVSHEEVPIGTTDFRTLITKLKSLQPQAVFVNLQDTSSIGPFNQQLKDLGVKTLLFGVTSVENPENLQKFPHFFDGMVYSFPHISQTASYQSFAQAFKQRYGQAPAGPSVVAGYNAALMLLAALNTGATTGEQLKAALNKVHTPGVGVEDLSFNSNGQISGAEFEIKTIKDNQFVTVE